MDLFLKQPGIELAEFCLSSNYLPESEEKQLHVLACLKAQTRNYITRSLCSFIQLLSNNFSLLSPRVIQQFFELIQEMNIRFNPTPDLDSLLTACLLSEDPAMNQLADSLLHKAFGKSALPSPKLQAAATLRERKLRLVESQDGETFPQLIQRFRGSNSGLKELVEEIYKRCVNNLENKHFVLVWAELCPKVRVLVQCLGL